jgi:hypothetical protein
MQSQYYPENLRKNQDADKTESTDIKNSIIQDNQAIAAA